MEREVFIREFSLASEEIDEERLNSVLLKSIEVNNESGKMRGLHNLIIVTEELSELTKEVTKTIRGKGNSADLLQEVADVALCIRYLKEICNISDESINKAINVKIDRLDEAMRETGSYR